MTGVSPCKRKTLVDGNSLSTEYARDFLLQIYKISSFYCFVFLVLILVCFKLKK